MSSSRRFSVVRHIQNIHKGKGLPIPFVEYLIGRRDGKYLPREVKSVQSHEPFVNMLLEEIDKDFARKVATRVNKPANDPGYNEIASLIINYKQYKFHQEILQDIRDGLFKF